MKARSLMSVLGAAALLYLGTAGAQAGGHGDLLREMPRSFPGDTMVTAFPGDTMTPRQARMLNDIGVSTVQDLAEADPQQVGRILDLDPRSAQTLQQELRQRMR